MLVSKSLKIQVECKKYTYLQIVETFNISTLNSKLRAPYELYVSVKVPALGHTTLNVDGVKSNDR